MRRFRIFPRGPWLHLWINILLVIVLIFGTYPIMGGKVLAQTEEVVPNQASPPPVDHIVISPDAATITTGQAQSYTATAYDAEGNEWDITADTTFSIDPGAGGFWSDNTYTSEFAGTWTVTGAYESLTDDATLTVEQAPTGPVPVVEPVEQQPPQLPAQASEIAAVLVSPDKDVEISSPNGRVNLRIPRGAVSTPVEVELAEHALVGSTGMGMVSLFELNARLPESGEKFNQFSKELEISIQHDPEDLRGLNVDSLRLYYLDENSRRWVPVPTSKYDSQQMVLTATITHFSYYGEQADPIINGPGRVMAAQVNMNSGAAVFSYPIELPPGPGGFQPSLELAYNSGSVDEMKNKRSMGSWVGIGWTLHLGRISYDLTDGLYFLDLNGASYQLATTDDINYRTNPDQYFKITRSGNTWEMWDREGVYYRFGGTTDSEQYAGYDSPTYDYSYYRWDLSLIRDTNGNEATVSYIRDVTEPYVRSAYPEYLTYGNVQVHFTAGWDEYDSMDGYLRKDNPKSYGYYNLAPKVMENRKLDSIEIKVSGVLVRKYIFAYNTTDRVYSSDYGGIYYSGKHTLTSITQVGADGASQLPAMNFTYQDLQTYRHGSTYDYTGNSGNPASFDWPHLTTVNSGFGGTISFAYTQIPDTTAIDTWTREVVETKTVSSGIDPDATYTYDYTGDPQYLGLGWDQKYRGFAEVEETDSTGNYSKHWFYTTGEVNGEDTEKLSGREYKTQWFDSSDNLLREKDYDWTWVSTSQTYNVFYPWSNPGTGDGFFGNAWGITTSNDGYVYVSDNSEGRIQKFDEYRNFILKWGTVGSAAECYYPYGLAGDSQGNIYMAGTDRNRILKFDSSGNFILIWGTEGAGDGQFSGPWDVAVDSQGYVYVADTGNNRIQKFDSSGNFILKWGTSGTGDGQFGYPQGIAVDSQGYVYVADTNNNRIQKFDSSGNFILKWGTYGTGDGQFSYPRGIAADSQGYVYVADTNNNRILKFDSSGNFILKWGQLNQPYDIAVNNQDNVYVADTYSYRIQKFDSNGNFILKWGTYGTGDGQFSCPVCVAIDSQDNIYVSDLYYNNRIQKFNSNGGFILKWNTDGAYGEFYYPYGIAVDSQGYVYVAENNNSRIQKFDSSGSFILKWGTSGTGDGQFHQPQGVAVDSQGYVYVADTGNNRIQKFDSSGNFILKWGTYGTGDSQFNGPRGIAVDSQNYVYVADTGNHRIQKFDPSGNFILKWSAVGIGYGIAVDSQGYVYVADFDNHRIQKFDSSGNFILKWGAELGSTNWVFSPYGVAVSPYSLYATDGDNHRVLEYIRNWAVQLSAEEETIGSKTSRTRYEYDDYGNVITQYIDGDLDTNDDDATIHLVFYPNEETNILSKIAEERVYTTITDDVGGANLRKETHYYYDGNDLTTPPTIGNLTRLEQKTSETTSVNSYFTYDTYGNKLTNQDPNGNITIWTYETTHNTYPETVTSPDPLGLSESFIYDPGTNNLLSVTDFNGQTTTYEYDTFKRLVMVFKPGDYPDSPSIEYQYNNWGTINQQHLKTLAKVAEGDYLWQSQYFDGLGRVVQVHARGEAGRTIISSTTVFNDRGLVDEQYVSQDLDSSQVDGYEAPEAGWKYASYEYDGLNRITTIINADGTTISHDYSTAWQDTVTNELDNQKCYYFDAFNRLIQVEELNESYQVYATTEYSYDVLGNLTQVVDNSGNETNISYDWLSRKTDMTDPDMGIWSYSYDNNGNLISQTDAKGQTIEFVYDELNRLTGKTYPQGSGMTDVIYEYDSTDFDNYGKGQRTKMTDALGTTSYKYDTRGRLIEEKRTVDTVDYTTQFTYDSADRIATITYPITGEVVTNGYNERGLPDTLSGSTVGDLVTSTLYNNLGQVTEINLGNWLKSIFGYWGVGGDYDNEGGYYGHLWRTATVSEPQTETLRPNAAGDESNITWQYPSSGSHYDKVDEESADYNSTYVYTSSRYYLRDLYNLPASSGSGTINFIKIYFSCRYNGPSGSGYAKPSLKSDGTVTDGTEVSLTNSYVTYSEQWDTNPADGEPWEWADIDALQIGISLKRGSAPDVRCTQLYVEVNYSVGQYDTLFDTTYTWDASGNLTQREDILADETETFTYDFLDRLTYVSGPYSESYTYDEIGNIISKNGVSYTYGSQPHAVTAVGETSYEYDVNGNMTTRGSQTLTWDYDNRPVSITDGENTSTFVYDGDGNRAMKTEAGETILYINGYYEKNLTTDEVTTSYYLGGRLIAQRKGTDLNYIHQDHLSGTAVTSDSDGTQTSSIKYFPFGTTRSVSGTVPTDKKFTGQRLDETGLYYYGARYYDAEIGRFISADAVASDLANPQVLNRYAYTLNNPLKYIDPSGLDVIVVGGHGSTQEQLEEQFEEFIASLELAEGEIVIYLPDFDPGNLDVGPRLQQLSDTLMGGGLTDITLIGYSEGAATVGAFLSRLADMPAGWGKHAAREINAAILLECPTGEVQDGRIKNYNSDDLNGLPRRLQDAGINIRLADIWNKASVVHMDNLSGWRSFSYDSRGVRGLRTEGLISQTVNTFRTGGYHSDILHSEYAMRVALDTMLGPRWTSRD